MTGTRSGTASSSRSGAPGTTVADVLVLGGGPAGRALAAACAEAGLRTTLADPAPERAWTATYCAWPEELPAPARGDGRDPAGGGGRAARRWHPRAGPVRGARHRRAARPPRRPARRGHGAARARRRRRRPARRAPVPGAAAPSGRPGREGRPR
ncbi:lycopene cyclase family protein [Pseudonocardia alni]|uniref:lycopene cyclase family protein n=1 Tax=Pseudonocardia alni TaxID=33907 RepID=UPI00386ADDE0